MKKLIVLLFLVGTYCNLSAQLALDIENNSNCAVRVLVYESNTSGCVNNVLLTNVVIAPSNIVPGITPTPGFNIVGARVFETNCAASPPAFLFIIGDGGACQSYCTALTTNSAPSFCCTSISGLWSPNSCMLSTLEIF